MDSATQQMFMETLYKSFKILQGLSLLLHTNSNSIQFQIPTTPRKEGGGVGVCQADNAQAIAAIRLY